jgi:hypothetical protein
MDDTKPLINLNGLVISGECFPVTPTPSTTPYEYCYVSATTQTFGEFQCPNNGFIYNDIYGKLTLYATLEGVIKSSHPQLNFIITNGVENQSISILDGQEFTEFVYPRVNFFYTETTCELVSLPDWRVLTPPVTRCLFFTPTPTVTPTVTPTMTQTSTPTTTLTSTPTQTETSTPTPTPTTTLTSTPTQTATQTQTPTTTTTLTASPTQSQTSTPTNTRTQTPTATQTQTPTTTTTLTASPTQTPTNTSTPTNTMTQTPSPTPLPNPALIPNLFQWFDAASGSTFTTSVSGTSTFVSSWQARIGNSVSQANISLQPRLVSGANGLPYSGVTFSGLNITMSGATSTATPSGNTTFIVSYAPAKSNALTFTIDTNNGEGISSQYVNGNIMEGRTVGKKVQFNQWSAVSTTRPYYAYALMIVSGNSSNSSGLLNDTIPSTASTFSAGTTMTGIRMSDVVADSDGTIYEILVYNRVLNSTEIEQVKYYLERKWNYSQWGIFPTPTPTPTKTPTQTPTPSTTPPSAGTYIARLYGNCIPGATFVVTGTYAIGKYYCYPRTGPSCVTGNNNMFQIESTTTGTGVTINVCDSDWDCATLFNRGCS